MARTVTIKNEDLLSATRAVILEKGTRATAADIAAHAGVSEGTLFKRFHTKEGLFRAALELSEDVPQIISELPALVGKGDLRQTLVEICNGLIENLSIIMPLIMLAYQTGEESTDPGPMRSLLPLTKFFAAEARLGRMKNIEPEIAAATLIGALVNHVITAMFQRQSFLPIPQATYVRGLVHMLWTGFAPRK